MRKQLTLETHITDANVMCDICSGGPGNRCVRGVVLKPGTERNGTERTERTERSFFVAGTKVGPISVYM